MSSREGIRLEDLSRSQQEVARLIGLENLQKLAEAYGGGYLYIPKRDRLARAARNRRIRAEFDGQNLRRLAQKYGLTEISIRGIVSGGTDSPPKKS